MELTGFPGRPIWGTWRPRWGEGAECQRLSRAHIHQMEVDVPFAAKHLFDDVKVAARDTGRSNEEIRVESGTDL